MPFARARADEALSYVATREEFQGYASKLWKLVSSGDLAVKVYKEYPFTAEGVRQAHEDLGELPSTVGQAPELTKRQRAARRAASS